MFLLPDSLRRLVNLCVPVHAYNVSELAERAAPLLCLDPAVAGMAGLLHDIGKLSVPAEVLNAIGPLVGAAWSMLNNLLPDLQPTQPANQIPSNPPALAGGRSVYGLHLTICSHIRSYIL